MQSGAFAPALPGQVDAAATALSEPNLKSWPVRMPVAVWLPQAREQFAPFWVRVRGIGADGLLASIFPAACEVEAGVSRHCCHVTLSELTDAQEDCQAASGRLAARCAQVPLRSQLAAAAAVGNTVSSAERHIIIVEQRQQ